MHVPLLYIFYVDDESLLWEPGYGIVVPPSTTPAARIIASRQKIYSCVLYTWWQPGDEHALMESDAYI